MLGDISVIPTLYFNEEKEKQVPQTRSTYLDSFFEENYAFALIITIRLEKNLHMVDESMRRTDNFILWY